MKNDAEQSDIHAAQVLATPCDLVALIISAWTNASGSITPVPARRPYALQFG